MDIVLRSSVLFLYNVTYNNVLTQSDAAIVLDSSGFDIVLRSSVLFLCNNNVLTL